MIATTPTLSAARETNESAASADAFDEAWKLACERIAPTWPLDRFIAVNPFWALIDTPLPAVAAELSALSGARLLMPRTFYRCAHREGRLQDRHLQAALDESGSPLSLADLRSLLEMPEPVVPMRARVVDVADARRNLRHEVSWRTFVTHSVSQFCAGHFDEGQAQLGPSRDGGLYASWRRHALVDRSPALLLGASGLRAAARELPVTARELAHTALTALEIPPSELTRYLWSLLLDQNGWASWCAYRRWTARLDGRDDDAISDLLAVRLAWEWLLHRTGGAVVARDWHRAKAIWTPLETATAARSHDWLLQVAMEIAWREPLLRALPSGLDATPRPPAQAQAVFCIDVRSEVFRRALEATAPSVHTLGFAGFFGVALAYQPIGSPEARPQLPGLLAPRLHATDTGVAAHEAAARAARIDLGTAWKSFQADPLSTFTFVEALGVTYAGKLLADSFGLGAPRSTERAGLVSEVDTRRKPRLVGALPGEDLDPEARGDLAANMLRGMSLTHDFARVVLLVGHGSTTRNNPHAAGLDCGACCGQTGEINARVAASLLNEPAVRAGLARRGIVVPDTTRFVAALHNTTTDEVEPFDLDELPASHLPDLDRLRAQLAAAGARARAERAPRLGLAEADPSTLREAMRARTTDWSQVRAEWGLANNAAFIAAPRNHTLGLDFEGRAFLHEYRHDEDEGYAVLASIMTAPMVVAHWINFQYYASTVDNVRYGSGNKTLHNVVGGHLGVFEGNGGDLRIGLPLQSLHDGTQWVHTPLRLAVFLEAPQGAIDGVIAKHAHVRALVTQGWISLFRIDEAEGAVFALRGDRWHRASPATPPA